MPYTNHAKHTMLDHLVQTVYVSAHNAEPVEGGAENEIAGVTRQEVTFAAASGGAVDSSNTPVLPIPAGQTVTHIGFYDAATGGNLLAFRLIPSEVFTNAGTLTIDDVDLDLNK